MKIETNGTTNFNHVQQYKKSASLEKTTASNNVKERSSFQASESNALEASQTLQQSNDAISTLQVLNTSIETLSSNATRLQELSRRYEHALSDKIILEDEFLRVNEQMMDTIDNSIYNGQQLFSGDYAVVLADGQGLVSIQEVSGVESLDITDRASIVRFSEQLDSIHKNIDGATQFLNISANNTLAAMSSETLSVSQDSLLSKVAQSESLEGLKESHNIAKLQQKIESLLG